MKENEFAIGQVRCFICGKAMHILDANIGKGGYFICKKCLRKQQGNS